jgi:hypothetical protein
VALKEQMQKFNDDSHKSIMKQLKNATALNDIYFKNYGTLGEQKKLQEGYNKALGLTLETHKLDSEILGEHIKAQEDIFKAKIAEKDITEERIKEETDNFKEILEELKRQKKIKDEAASLEDRRIDYQKSSLTRLSKLTIQSEIFKKVQMAALNPAHALLNLFSLILETTLKITQVYDQQRAELAKLAGITDSYNEALANSAYHGRQYALSAQEAMEGTRDLISAFQRLSELTKEQIANIGALSGALKQFGLDAAKNMNEAMMIFRMGADESALLARRLFDVGDALGPTMAKQISEQFGPSMSKLAAYTKDRAIKTLEGLAVQARATGLDLSKLLGIAEQFDTFDGAAQAVGRLNSMLGGDYLNSVQMLYATETQRIDMIREGIRMSGRQFSDMERFERKAVANAIGVTDIAEAMKLLGTEQERFDELAAKAAAAGLTIDQFNEKVAATKDIGKKWAAVLQNLGVVMKPIVDFLHWITNLMVKAATGTNKWIVGLITLGVVLLGLYGLFKLYTVGITVFAKALVAAATAAGPMAVGLETISAAAVAGSVGLGIMAAVFVAIGLALLAAGHGAKALGEGIAAPLKALKELGGTAAKFAIIKEITTLYTSMSKISPINALSATKAVEALHKVIIDANYKKSERKEIKVVVDHKNLGEFQKTLTAAIITAVKQSAGRAMKN